MGPQDVYTSLVNSPLTSLLEGVMGLGLFVVGLGYLRHIARDPKILRHSGVWKRALLLGAVVMFVTYITVAYEVDIGPPDEEFMLPVKEVAQAKLLTLMMLPIDLLGVGLMAALFAILSLEDLPDLLKGAGRKIGLYDQIGLLFLVTGAWHVVMVAWWFMFTLHTGGVGSWFESWQSYRYHNLYDVVYHVAFGVAHLSYFWLWKRMEDGAWVRARRGVLEWWGVLVYVSLVTSVYVTRLSSYVDKYGIGNRQSGPLFLEPFVLPAVVCFSVLLLQRVRKALGLAVFRIGWEADR